MTHWYAFANQKGGVGKTTSVVNVAAAMAAWGVEVLVVDIDPQCNATTSLGINASRLQTSLYNVLLSECEVTDVVVETRWPCLHLLPSNPTLAGLTVELHQLPARERAELLKSKLASLDGRYAYILIDTPPSLGVLTVNSFAASKGVIVPVQCEYLALEGLTQLMHTISLVQRSLNPELILRGIVMTMYDGRTALARQVVNEVRKHFPGRVFSTIVPRSVRLSEAPSYGEPGVIFAPRSSGSAAYRLLTRELLKSDGIEVS